MAKVQLLGKKVRSQGPAMRAAHGRPSWIHFSSIVVVKSDIYGYIRRVGNTSNTRLGGLNQLIVFNFQAYVGIIFTQLFFWRLCWRNRGRDWETWTRRRMLRMVQWCMEIARWRQAINRFFFFFFFSAVGKWRFSRTQPYSQEEWL